MLILGYARAEILAAFGNAIFLLALCFSIFLEAVQRFIDVQGQSCCGLASSIYAHQPPSRIHRGQQPETNGDRRKLWPFEQYRRVIPFPR